MILEEIYVHMEVKLKDFGPEANPIPALNIIEKQIETITDLEFHKQLSDIFFRLRDLHSLYYLPKPFACYESFLPFDLKEVKTADGKVVIAVSEVGDDEAVLKLLPKPFNVKVGDIITSYDGLSITDAIKAKMPRSLGANPGANKRKSIEALKYFQHNLDFLPENDSVKLEFQNSDGVKYKTELPWIAYTDWSCLAEDHTPEQNNQITNNPFSLKLNPLKLKPKTNRPHKPSKTRGETPQGHTGEPILYWQINKSIYGEFGYIQLVSFTPDVFTTDEVVTTIKNLLRNELKNTDGLMFDFRTNPGGQLPLAEKLVQLISPRAIVPSTFALKNSPANLYYMNNVDSLGPFTLAINEAQQMGLPYTKQLPIDSFEQINDIGQVYFKPVAVFVDSGCYSACETFASLVQDFKVATVFGEDASTGGGGANVYNLNEMIADFGDMDTGPFKKLYHGQNISFAFRESFRGGINKGVHIEDAGVKADRLAPPSMSDLFNATNDQLLVLQKFLKKESPKYTSNIFLANEERHDFFINKKAKFSASWNNTTSMEFKKGGKSLETRSITSKGTNVDVGLPKSVATDKVGQGRLEILGANAGARVWRKILNYRVIPESKIIAINQNLNISLKDERDVALYTHNTLKKNGWNISDDSLYLGNGSEYANLSHAEASLFITMPKANYELKFDASVKTEASLDTLKVIAVYQGTEVVLVDKLSGDIPMTRYEVDLSQFSGKAIEIRFVFESDEGTTDKGITIKNISVSQVNNKQL
ncbi:MAG: S41 family peptidase [Bacteriovorax sp.]